MSALQEASRHPVSRERPRHRAEEDAPTALTSPPASSAPERPTKKDLITLEAEDILKSRVFDGGVYGKGLSVDEASV